MLLLTQRADVINSVAPSKLLTYMAASRPVLAAVHHESAAAKLIGEAKCGVIVRPDDPMALIEGLRSLGRTPERRVELGAAGRTFVENKFNKQRVLAQWDALLRATVSMAADYSG